MGQSNSHSAPSSLVHLSPLSFLNRTSTRIRTRVRIRTRIRTRRPSSRSDSFPSRIRPLASLLSRRRKPRPPPSVSPNSIPRNRMAVPPGRPSHASSGSSGPSTGSPNELEPPLLDFHPLPTLSSASTSTCHSGSLSLPSPTSSDSSVPPSPQLRPAEPLPPSEGPSLPSSPSPAIPQPPSPPRSPSVPDALQSPTRRIYVQGMVVARNIADPPATSPFPAHELPTLPPPNISDFPFRPPSASTVLMEQATMVSRLLSVAAAATASSLLPSALNSDGTTIPQENTQLTLPPSPHPANPPSRPSQTDSLTDREVHGGLQNTLRDALRAAFGSALLSADHPSSPQPVATTPSASPQQSSVLAAAPTPSPPTSTSARILHRLGLDHLLSSQSSSQPAPTPTPSTLASVPDQEPAISHPSDPTPNVSEAGSFERFLSELQSDVGMAILQSLGGDLGSSSSPNHHPNVAHQPVAGLGQRFLLNGRRDFQVAESGETMESVQDHEESPSQRHLHLQLHHLQRSQHLQPQPQNRQELPLQTQQEQGEQQEQEQEPEQQQENEGEQQEQQQEHQHQEHQQDYEHQEQQQNQEHQEHQQNREHQQHHHHQQQHEQQQQQHHHHQQQDHHQHQHQQQNVTFNFFRMHRFDQSITSDNLVPVLLVGVRSAPPPPPSPPPLQQSTTPGVSDVDYNGLRELFGERYEYHPQDGWESHQEEVENTEQRGGTDGSAAAPAAPIAPSRSWLIFVLAGLYPSTHPIFTAPTLYIPTGPTASDSSMSTSPMTATPTGPLNPFGGNLDYETMLGLAELIGQVKPPTATAQQIETARLRVLKNVEQLEILRRRGSVLENTAEKCLICLSEYAGEEEEEEEEMRLLRCKHLFHRHCIDEWLMNGSATCPACRDVAV